MKTGNFEWTDDTHTAAKFVERPDGWYFVTDKGIIGRTGVERAGIDTPGLGGERFQHPVDIANCFKP